jgi:hypothetical protein
LRLLLWTLRKETTFESTATITLLPAGPPPAAIKLDVLRRLTRRLILIPSIWFNTLKDTSCTADGYPWTRLGYAYDWGNPKSEVGLSEFVIKSNADVEVKGIYANEEYCDK